MRMFGRECTHLDQLNEVESSGEGCEECLRMGETWGHLRECLVCGYVGCCDISSSLRVRNGVVFQAALSPAGAVHYSLAT